VKVQANLVQRGLRVTVDVGDDKLGAKIRNARLMRQPYIVVIGDEEAQTGTLSVRSRDAGELGKLGVGAFASRLLEESQPPKVTI
jgi:threonyl-tRNA synthetase